MSRRSLRPQTAGYIAVAVTHSGDIIIGDNAADKVYRLSAGTLTTMGNLPSSPTELQNVDIVVEPDGGVMVADDTTTGTVQLVHFEPTGVQARQSRQPSPVREPSRCTRVAISCSPNYAGQRIFE